MADAEARKQQVKNLFDSLTIDFKDWNALERKLIEEKLTQQDLYTFETFSVFVKNCLRGN